MAKRIIASGDAHPIPKQRADLPVFELNAKYFADQEAQAGDLSFDAACIHEALQETLQSVLSRIEECESDKAFASHLSGLLFGAIYLARLAAGMASTADILYRREAMTKGGAQ